VVVVVVVEVVVVLVVVVVVPPDFSGTGTSVSAPTVGLSTMVNRLFALSTMEPTGCWSEATRSQGPDPTGTPVQ
jgi:hypothetical protein